jgi:hypothetical protein
VVLPLLPLLLLLLLLQLPLLLIDFFSTRARFLVVRLVDTVVASTLPLVDTCIELAAMSLTWVTDG